MRAAPSIQVFLQKRAARQRVTQLHENMVEAAGIVKAAVGQRQIRRAGVGQREREGRALADSGFRHEHPAVALRDAAAEGQPDAETVRRRGVEAVRIQITLEDVGKALRLDAAARVGHGELNMALAAFDAHADRAALRREFQRVGEQVQKRALEHGGVECDDVALVAGGKAQRDAAQREKRLGTLAERVAEADDIVIAQPEASALHQLARVGEVADQTQHLMAAHRENGCIFIQHGVGLTRFRRRETVRRGKHVRHRGAELGRNVRQDLGQKLEVFFVKRHHKVRLLWESCSYPLQDGAIFAWKKVPQRDERNVR